MSARLENYLRTYRKRTGFSQREVAFLLGCSDGTKVSRYERLARKPTLHAVFAYEMIFRVPAREMFAGLYQKVEQRILERARRLDDTLSARKLDRVTARKLAALRALSFGSKIVSGEKP